MLAAMLAGLAVAAALAPLVERRLGNAAAWLLVAENVDHGRGTRDATALGGLARALPFTFAAAVLAALSLAGAPPMFGFLGKEGLCTSKLELEALGAKLVIAAAAANIALVGAAGLVATKPFLSPARAAPPAPT